MIITRGGISSFQIIKFHIEHNCNLLRLNMNHMECNSSFIIDQIKNQVMTKNSYKRTYLALHWRLHLIIFIVL